MVSSNQFEFLLNYYYSKRVTSSRTDFFNRIIMETNYNTTLLMPCIDRERLVFGKIKRRYHKPLHHIINCKTMVVVKQ